MLRHARSGKIRLKKYEDQIMLGIDYYHPICRCISIDLSISILELGHWESTVERACPSSVLHSCSTHWLALNAGQIRVDRLLNEKKGSQTFVDVEMQHKCDKITKVTSGFSGEPCLQPSLLSACGFESQEMGRLPFRLQQERTRKNFDFAGTFLLLKETDQLYTKRNK